jgi:ActR/RegA family two-component response regulator
LRLAHAPNGGSARLMGGLVDREEQRYGSRSGCASGDEKSRQIEKERGASCRWNKHSAQEWQCRSGRYLSTMAIDGMEAEGALAIGLESRNPSQVGEGYYHCLIVSSRTAYSEALAETASRSGWETSVCATAEEAHRCLEQLYPQLAFVDLVDSNEMALRGVARRAAESRRVLLVICGHEEKLAEELWARELGAWFYLPAPRESGTIGLLCRDARTIVATAQAGTGARSKAAGEQAARRRD